MKIGIIGRGDNTGLGNMTWEFYQHLPIDKIMLFQNRYRVYTERFKNPILIEKNKLPTDLEIKEFLSGLDLAICFETPYNWNTFAIAKELGVKTIMFPMYEYLDKKSSKPDLYICPSLLDFEEADGNKIFIPTPVNLDRLERRCPTSAKRFIFNVGHGGKNNRNSSFEFIEALTEINLSDLEFIIHTQKDFPPDLPKSFCKSKIRIIRDDLENYWDLWKEGDVFIMPHKFAGLSLPIQEAMATGLPVISTNFFPFNTYIQREMLIEPDIKKRMKIFREIDIYCVSPRSITKKIHEVAKMSKRKLKEVSDFNYAYAKSISWENLLPKYLQVFNELVYGKENK